MSKSRSKKAANDNGSTRQRAAYSVQCDFPDKLGIIEGEADLVARYMGELLRAAANDNEEGQEEG